MLTTQTLERCISFLTMQIELNMPWISRMGLCIWFNNNAPDDIDELKDRLIQQFPSFNIEEEHCWTKDNKGDQQRITFLRDWITELQINQPQP